MDQAAEEIAGVLRHCERGLDVAQAETLARFGASALGLASLPDLQPGRASPGQLHAAATLLYTLHLSRAGIPEFTERLAERLSEGSLSLHLGPTASNALARYHRARRFRHSPPERRAIYSRLFGGPGAVDPNASFAPQMTALVGFLREAGGHRGEVPVHLRVRIGQAALVLGVELSARAAGATRYDAERILADIRTSHALLRDPDLVHVLGGGPPLRLITRNAVSVLGHPLDPTSELTRGRAGTEILRWIADYVLVSGAPSLRADDPVVQSAAYWEIAGG